ncbi:MAG: immunity 53 family protein [Flavobacterium sp.]
MNKIELIQQWYKNQCDGEWEHIYGIKIETLDNPGWRVEISLKDTCLENRNYSKESIVDDNNWMIINADGEIFKGYGDTSKLDLILEEFISSFAIPYITESTSLYTLYEEIETDTDIKVYKKVSARMHSLDSFEIVSIPFFELTELMVLDLNDFKKIQADKIRQISRYQVGDIVQCELVTMFDCIGLVIV